jgi:hypothetical protein
MSFLPGSGVTICFGQFPLRFLAGAMQDSIAGDLPEAGDNRRTICREAFRAAQQMAVSFDALCGTA